MLAQGGKAPGGTLAEGLLQPPVTSAKPSSIPQTPRPPKCSTSSTSLPIWAFLPSLSPLSPHCWFTHQFGLLIVPPQAQLLQPKASPQTRLALPRAFCGCWTSTAGRARWAPFYPMHEAILQWPKSNRDHRSLGTAPNPPHLLQDDQGCVATPSPAHGAQTSSQPTGAFLTARFPAPAMAEGGRGCPCNRRGTPVGGRGWR